MHALVNERQPPGEYEVSWDGVNTNGQELSGGVYFYVLKSDEFTISGKMI